ncbi:MAG TPA: hypothetical protein VMS22_14210 [Candidatus Eisenbacteria bacterium]|nr:hypothetical protein [Candidatus Eisenbacteria bacterium]
MSAPPLDVKSERILWIGALVVCALSLGRAVPSWRDELAAKYDLVYETPSLRTIELLRDDRNPYDPAVYAHAPFWITMYTPLYHAISATMPSDPQRPFLAGRIVNLSCVLLLVALLFVVREGESSLAALALGAFFLVRPVCSNAAILKGDFLGVMFAFVAVLCADRARVRSAWILPSALCCVLAIASKQSMVAASAACVAFMLLANRRRGLALSILLVSLLGAFALLAQLKWGDGFWFSIWTAPQNPMSGAIFRWLWREMLWQPVAMLNLVFGLTMLAVLVARRGRGAFTESPFVIYWIASAAVLLATLGKLGAAANYFHEWEFASLALMVFAGREVAAAFGGRRFAITVSAVMIVAAGTELLLTRGNPMSYTFATPEGNRRAAEQAEKDAADIRQISGDSPKILNLYYPGIGYPLPGEICVNDPYLYALLFQSGKLSPEILQDALAAREFDSVIVPINFLSGGYPVARELLTPLRENYGIAKRFAHRATGPTAGFDYLVPRPSN